MFPQKSIIIRYLFFLISYCSCILFVRIGEIKRSTSRKQSCVAFTLNGFDDQVRNLTFVKTYFQVLKVKLNACNFKQALYRVTLTAQKYLVNKSACVSAAIHDTVAQISLLPTQTDNLKILENKIVGCSLLIYLARFPDQETAK